MTPLRHGRRGGTTATSGGINFNSGNEMGEDVVEPVVKIGGRVCRMKTFSDRVITCRVPWGKVPGSQVTMKIEFRSGVEIVLEKAIWYMN